MYQFARFFNFVSSIASMIGIVCFFINPTITIICGILSLVNSILQVAFSDQNNLSTEITTIIIAIILALIIKTPIIPLIALFLCGVEILMLIISWIFISRY